MSLPIKYHPLTDDFILTKNVLGIGINGKVVEGIGKADDITYAIKVLKDDERTRREAEIHYRASDCTNIVRLYCVYSNVYEDKTYLIFVMECLKGGELFQRIQQRTDKPFTEREASSIMLEICCAVDYLHTMNIAHRDLKPENFLYTKKLDDSILKLTDFGFAKECNSKSLQTPCYTPYYVAPEVLGMGKYDKSCDMWSVGVIMYILLCGYPPFYSVSGVAFSPGMRKRIHAGQYEFPPTEWDRVSGEAKGLIRSMLDTNPNNRLTIKELMTDPWISRNRLVPQTPLHTKQILSEERDNWPEIQREFANALQNMRVDGDKEYLKGIHQIGSENALFAKRLKNIKASSVADQESKNDVMEVDEEFKVGLDAKNVILGPK